MSNATDTMQRQATEPTVQEQAQQVLMPLAAGYVGHRTIAIGLRQGLLDALAEHPDGMTADELAAATGSRHTWTRSCSTTPRPPTRVRSSPTHAVTYARA